MSKKLKFEDECRHTFGDPNFCEEADCWDCGASAEAPGPYGRSQDRIQSLCPVKLRQRLADVRNLVEGDQSPERKILALYEMFGLYGQ